MERISSFFLMTWSLVFVLKLISTFQGFFQDFLLGPFLQRRLSLAEQLGWLTPPPPPPPPPPSINVVETQCVKAGALRDTINWLKIANVLFFVCFEMKSSHFFSILGFPTEN
jgi:hypothetical protein